MKSSRLRSLALAGALSCVCAPALAEDVYVKLKGFEEVPSTSTGATGSFFARIDTTAGTIAYRLNYSGLHGNVLQAHIHFGARSTNGGVMVFLCETTTNPDPTTLAPTCPQSGTVSGVLRADNVVGPAAQGIAASEFAEMVRAIRRGVAYVNVHSATFPGGEIRGQLNEWRNVVSF
jgi:hypothetical protein